MGRAQDSLSHPGERLQKAGLPATVPAKPAVDLNGNGQGGQLKSAGNPASSVETSNFQFEPTWIPFEKYSTLEEKKKIVREDVKRIASDLTTLYANHSLEQTNRIDSAWQLYRDRKNDEWLDRFFELEKQFQSCSRDFLERYLKRTELEDQVDRKAQEIKSKDKELQSVAEEGRAV